MITLEADQLAPATLTDPATLDAHVQDLTATLGEPTLITLSSETETLRFGIGHHGGASVVLFLDQAHEPWHAINPKPSPAASDEVEFRTGSTVYRFDGELRVPDDLARSAARQFIETESKPTVLRWRREPTE